ncbi:MAG: hypothetical protein DSY47_05695 [Hydrogenothermus sp.]|nr:MAG: hypothetical protein DSY47_05695 [Hydrogenothermus sp.]
MKLQNLIFNKLGNSFSVMISNPEIEIMEKAEGLINVENNTYYYEIEGIDTIHSNNNILKILVKLFSKEFEYPVEISFLDNGDILVKTKEELKGKFENENFIFSFVNEEPISIFKLSAYNAKFFEFAKEEKYVIKIKEENLIKGLLELTFVLYE